MVKPSIALKNVSKSFHQGGESICALNQVSFEAYPGEIVIIVGPSGCGKTTLLSIIAGTLKADTGSLLVYDHDYEKATENDLLLFRRAQIGFIFQQYHLIHTLTCLENVTIPLILNGVPEGEAMKRGMDLITQMGLKGREKENPKRLSGGQQQRIAIARALAHSPMLIVCDEPTAALDEKSGYRIMEILQDIAKMPNRTVIIVTHDPRIFPYATRVVEMNDGMITSQGLYESPT